MQFVYQHILLWTNDHLASKSKRFQMAWEKHFLMPVSVSFCILFQADLDDDDDDGSMCGVCGKDRNKRVN